MVDRMYKVAYGTAFRQELIDWLPPTTIDEDIAAKNADYVKVSWRNQAEVVKYFDRIAVRFKIVDAGGFFQVCSVDEVTAEAEFTPLTPPYQRIADVGVYTVKAKDDAPLGEVVYPKVSLEFRSGGATGTIVWTEDYDGAIIVTPFDPEKVVETLIGAANVLYTKSLYRLYPYMPYQYVYEPYQYGAYIRHRFRLMDKGYVDFNELRLNFKWYRSDMVTVEKEETLDVVALAADEYYATQFFIPYEALPKGVDLTINYNMKAAVSGTIEIGMQVRCEPSP